MYGTGIRATKRLHVLVQIVHALQRNTELGEQCLIGASVDERSRMASGWVPMASNRDTTPGSSSSTSMYSTYSPASSPSTDARGAAHDLPARFRWHYQQWLAGRDVVMRLSYVAGERMFVDFWGDRAEGVDPDSARCAKRRCSWPGWRQGHVKRGGDQRPGPGVVGSGAHERLGRPWGRDRS